MKSADQGGGLGPQVSFSFSSSDFLDVQFRVSPG